MDSALIVSQPDSVAVAGLAICPSFGKLPGSVVPLWSEVSNGSEAHQSPWVQHSSAVPGENVTVT
jgi:hypothetical protein